MLTFLESTVMSSLFWNNYDNGEPVDYYGNQFLTDMSGFRLGQPRLRQLRVITGMLTNLSMRVVFKLCVLGIQQYISFYIFQCLELFYHVSRTVIQLQCIIIIYINIREPFWGIYIYPGWSLQCMNFLPLSSSIVHFKPFIYFRPMPGAFGNGSSD